MALQIHESLTPSIIQVPMVLLLLAFSFSGLFWGFLDTFLFWYLEDLGTPKVLMGTSMAVATLVGIPTSIYSRFILKKLKHHVVVFMGLLVFGIRMIGYSMISKIPELFLIFEAIKPISTTLFMIATFDFIRISCPMTTFATVYAIFGAVHFGFGRGVGGLAGGYATSFWGFQSSFAFFSILSFSVAVIYIILSCIDLKISRKSISEQKLPT